MQKNIPWQCRWSPTLGDLEDTHQNVWGTREYADNEIDREKPAVFMGLYSFADFYALWRHKGKKAILWCGSDITRFIDGYWLDDKGVIKLNAKTLAWWIDANCESYCENHIEESALYSVGIVAKVVPSFLGNVKDYEISFKQGNNVYTSVSGDNFKLYGWNKIFGDEEHIGLAEEHRDINFHLYGNTSNPWKNRIGDFSNVFLHGRVPKEKMNKEIKKMQGALRLTEFDGFSEIIAKSLLWGQHPVSVISYPYTLRPGQLSWIKDAHHPNIAGREWLLKNVNKYPWNQKK